MNNERIFLVVDDNSIDRMIAEKTLKKCLDNPEVHCVEGSTQAIDWLKTNGANSKIPIVILLDMHMPVIDGFGFLELFGKLTDKVKSITTIFMLSSAQNNERKIIAKNYSEIMAVLEKPINVDELMEAIQ